VPCDAPYAGLDRFTEVAAERGLAEQPWTEEEYQEFIFSADGVTIERMVVVEDVDRDGDLDVLIARRDNLPTVFLNDGDAHFTVADAMPPADPELEVDLWGVADVDGDGLPDLFGNRYYGGGFEARNLGGGVFEALRPIQLDTPAGGELSAAAVAMGDLDRDGDLDAVIVSVHYDDEDPDSPPDPVFENVDGELVLAGWIDLGGYSVSSQASAVLDVGWDGEPDLWHFDDTGSNGPGSAIFTGFDAGPANVVDIAPELDADVSLTAMGLDAGDLTGDGRLDYCASDIGRPICLVATADGPFVQSGLALGLIPDQPAYPGHETVGWSMEFADIDHDGRLDVVHASGEDKLSRYEGRTSYPDLVWQARPDGTFQDVSALTGIDSPDNHYGLVAADLDGDGWLDVVTAGPTVDPKLYLNRCGEGAWLQVDFHGPAAAAQAIGTRVELQVGDVVRRRQVLGPRASGQSPSRLHFGLGDVDRVDRLTVLWTDGEVTELSDVPVDRLVWAAHPSVTDE